MEQLADGLRLYPDGSLLYRFWFRSAVPLFMKAYVELDVSGQDYVLRTGPQLVISNHVDNLDTYMIGSQIHRVIHYLARSDGVHARWLGRYWRLMACLPADREGFNIAVGLLREGQTVAVFPEGVISPHLVAAKPGVALLALRSGAPVLPCAIWGTERILHGPQTFFTRNQVHLRFGEPRRLRRGSGSAQALTDSLMRDIAAMLPPPYRGYYA